MPINYAGMKSKFSTVCVKKLRVKFELIALRGWEFSRYLRRRLSIRRRRKEAVKEVDKEK